MRVESDSLGQVSVPDDCYYGAQTSRAIENFQISGVPISHFPHFVAAFAYVKIACARSNRALGLIEEEKYSAIVRASEELAAGQLSGDLVVDVFQGGAGTSSNMNVNEVIANRALEILGLEKGRYDVIHPNNDVNRSQSTNDTYPTAIRIAILSANGVLAGRLHALAQTFRTKGTEFRDILKLGRTQLQDAVPMTLGEEFSAFATAIEEDMSRLEEISLHLEEVNLGGTAIGTRINASEEYQKIAVDELRKLTGLNLRPSNDLIEAGWDTGVFVLYSGMLKRIATKLSKISNDLRLLSSGPRGGLNEINLPPKQPGSTIMPGKVNPVIPEVVNQVAFHVIGADVAVTLASEAGQLQLNAMEPLIAYSILNSLFLLINTIRTLDEHCVAGIAANPAVCQRHLEVSTAEAASLVPIVGYECAAVIAKEVLASGLPLSEVLRAHPELQEKFSNRRLKPE